MKYCEKCGAELFDEAVICTKCGRMLEAARMEKKEVLSLEKRPSTLLAVFNFVFSLLAVITLFWMILGIGFGDVNVSAWIDYSKYSGFEAHASAWFWPQLGFIIPAFIFSLSTFAFGVVSFIMTLVEKLRGERLLAGIFKLVAGALLVIAAIVFLDF